MSDMAIIDQARGAPAPLDLSPGSEVRDWFTLLKPRVLSLVVYSGVAGLLVAPGHLHPVLAVTAILCIALAAGAAGAINMWYDRDIDAVMRRTANRPIPAGRIEPGSALAYGVALSLFSVVVMGLATNWLAAGVLTGSILFYTVIYTAWLKRRTPQNIVIGGAAGAFPPLIGWVAVTGSITLEPLILFAIIFFWTPPHFWSLSLWAHADYARAGVPMLPVVAGPRETRRQIVLYTVLLLPLAPLPWFLGMTSAVYGVTALALGLWFLKHAVAVLRDAQDEKGATLNNDAAARACFKYSISYLFVLFGVLVLDHLVFS
ncbi:protoheme IX farnesyltransferase [Rhodovarius crocodyli]|uniref:Protoheme IX farnesyltransferase n=1 Tax=Rhodovarius crocodyli TaxID=1979269 RepID=A0A437MHC8_9PROT|nr:heme o synthase [Rhodovarius crocodyli]RVT97053.1 protoheme IX farnesyltransferase [Rhodovarius crocodyli]